MPPLSIPWELKMSLSLVQYSDVKFQITNFKRAYTIFHSSFILIKLFAYYITLGIKTRIFQFFNESDFKKGPGFDPIVGSRAVLETQAPPPPHRVLGTRSNTWLNPKMTEKLPIKGCSAII